VKKTKQDAFALWLAEQDVAQVVACFRDFSARCRLGRREKTRLRRDIEAALMHYTAAGVPLETALARPAVRHFGGFYARRPRAATFYGN